MNQTAESLSAIDDQLSKRHLELDPGGYFYYLPGSGGKYYLCQAFHKCN